MKSAKVTSEDTTIRVSVTVADDPMQFDVVVQDSRGETHHEVKMSGSDLVRLAGDRTTPELCIWATFLFLLDREPKEAILCRFDISIVERYFSEFTKELLTYLDRCRAQLNT